jgi:hypothetical protein
VVAADGTIYVGTQATGLLSSGLVAFAPDGTEKWHYDTGSNDVYSGAAVRADGSVVFASSDGTLYALETTGQLRWSVSLGATALASPLVVPDGTIYMGTQSGLTAVHADGTVAWSYASPPAGSGGASLMPDGTIAFNAQTSIVVLNPSGTFVVDYPALDGSQLIDGAPTIGPGPSIWYGGFTAPPTTGSSTLYSYSQATGFQKREFAWANGTFFNGPALLADGEAVFGAPSSTSPTGWGFYVSAVTGGFTQWATYPNGVQAQPTVDVDGNSYFVTDTTVVSLDPTGAQRWTGGVDSSVWIGLAMGADGTLYIGTVNGYLYAYGP